jgi:hypothetical protein
MRETGSLPALTASGERLSSTRCCGSDHMLAAYVVLSRRNGDIRHDSDDALTLLGGLLPELRDDRGVKGRET